MALEIFKLVGSVFVDTGAAEKSLQETDKKAGGLGTTLVNGAKSVGKFALGFAGAATAAGAALVAISEETREYRTEMGKLEAAYTSAGHSTETATATYQALQGVLGDQGQAVEAAAHLAQLTTSAEELSTWTDIATGVYATFGNSLPIEGLTEAANETAKTGALTGGLADALNWAGVSEDAFQASLDACSTEQERQALITDTLNGLYSDAADAYRDVNGEVIAANESQEKLNSAMADIGGAVEPFITAGKSLIADVLLQLTPLLSELGATVIPLVTSAVSTIAGWVSDLSDRLASSGITFESVMLFAQELFSGTMTVLQGIWTSIGQPVWDLIMRAVNLVKGLFQEHMPAIQAFVQSAFSDIKVIWENNLQPALQAIGNFIQNVLAPAFEFVFNHVIAPAVGTAFKFIKDLWEGTLKPVFTGICDFVKGVFTGDFSGAFQALVDIVKGIFNGIVSVIKTPINQVIGIVNSFIRGLNKLKVPDWVPVVGGKGINIPTIPLLEQGGVLEQGQVGLLEGSGAEAVVPLHQNKEWISAVAQDMDAVMGGKSGTQVVALLSDILDALSDIAGMGIYMDGDALVGRMAKKMDTKLGQLQARKARA